MTQLARQAKEASRALARLTTAEKNSCLLAMADALEKEADAIKKANAIDMEGATGLSAAMLDRLKLDDKGIAAMAKGLREVARLPDPIGRILDEGRELGVGVEELAEARHQLRVLRDQAAFEHRHRTEW